MTRTQQTTIILEKVPNNTGRTLLDRLTHQTLRILIDAGLTQILIDEIASKTFVAQSVFAILTASIESVT